MCENSIKEICFQVFGWIFTLSTWSFIILSLVFRENILFIIFAVFAYFTHIFIELCSPIPRYLKNESNSQGIYKKMSIFFRTSPIINWSCECYHYVTHHYTTRNYEGEIEDHTYTERVVTYTGSSDMTYYSSRDISGPFLLNCDERNVNQKYYIKLELNDEINFADSYTTSDYLIQKNSFISAYKYRDAHFDFSERRYIPGLVEYNLVKIGKEEARCINSYIFFLFTMLSFAELYKFYFNSKCVYQKFTIKKTISTRFNLNGPEYVKRYQKTIPSIDLINKQFHFKPSEYSNLNNSYKVDLPLKEEVENANKNKNKIKIESINKNQISQQNYNEVVIHNKNEHNNSNSEEIQAPAILPNEEEKSSERLNVEKKLSVNCENKENNVNNVNNKINENDSVIFVNKQIDFNSIDNKQ